MAGEEPAKKKLKMVLEPRGYQLDVFDKAVKENIIVYLETGTGKTHIAVMLINDIENKLINPNDKRLAVFLAPTVPLVMQQAGVVSANTPFKVGVYYGAKGVDTWSVSLWKEQVDSHQVFVMTPQVFLDALSSSALKLETVELLIMDECHHAQGNHPYSLIMKTHYHVTGLKRKPRIFGMTASPVIKKGASSITNSRQIAELENILDAKVYTLKDREEVELFAPTPIQDAEYYDKPVHDFANLRSRLARLKTEFASQLNSSSSVLSQAPLKSKLLNKIYTSVEYCLTELGLLPAILAVETLLKKKPQICKWRPEMSPEEEEAKKHAKDRFLNGMHSILKEALDGVSQTHATIEAMSLAQRKGLITPKVLLLLTILSKYRDDEYIRCIVFVERVIASVVLARLICKLQFLSHVSCDYMAGMNDSSSRSRLEQQLVLDKFADGKLNVLTATSVAEEGLDVQKCSAVIRFDPCSTLRSHVQSRGRARRPASSYIWLLESGNAAQEGLLLQFLNSEKSVKTQIVTRTSMHISRDPPPLGDMEFVRVESGACRSTEDSVSFIHQFCARLPGDSYYNPRPSFSFREGDYGFICTIKFPPNAPLQEVEGPPKRTEQLSKKAACLEACQQLLDIGAIRQDTLCPDFTGLDEEEQVMPKDPAGKPKELCSSAKLVNFRARWIHSVGIQLHAYKLTFLMENGSRKYAKFAFLIESALEEELASFELVLHEKYGPVSAKLCPFGLVELDKSQIDAAKAYHELLLNGAFRRLDFRSSASGHWDESQSYLLLPLDHDDSVDWLGIFSAAEAFRALSGDLTVKEGIVPEAGQLHTACGSLAVSLLLDSIVVAVHSGRLFCVTGLLEHLNAESEMCGNKKMSYVEYYNNTYGKLLRCPMQPLLQVKQTRGFHNLLMKRTKVEGEQYTFVELPPELCLRTGLRSTIMSSLYLVPSFMHRFMGLNFASQLRSSVFPTCSWISASKILEALTSKKCGEDFSFENLELLGDSLLKFAVTRRLFLCYRSKHEGQLTARRSRATCNATLNRLAKTVSISEYIQDGLFNPSDWVAPGMYVVKDMLCQHDLTKVMSDDSVGAPVTKCINGHRWIRWKVLADVVEALIGLHLVEGGLESAMEFMTLIGIEVEFESSLMDVARQSSLPSSAAVFDSSIEALEQKLEYTFRNKSLLREAVTHLSETDTKVCYQRLEFLGDCVLDFLVTRHLYKAYPGLGPGLLTDMRSAEVNNNCFARVVVMHKLYRHLRHGSEVLDANVHEFVRAVQGVQDAPFGFKGPEAPKVLGDLLESIAGAVFVDSGFDLEILWKVMQPLLAPLVTPETLPLHPIRELRELGGSLDWDTETMVATARLEEFVESLRRANKKEAKKDAAQKLLMTMKDHGMKRPLVKRSSVQETELHTTHHVNVSKSQNLEKSGTYESLDTSGTSTFSDLLLKRCTGKSSSCDSSPETSESMDTILKEAINRFTSISTAEQAEHDPATLPDSIASQMNYPGGPRAFLYELCVKRQWGRPSFETDIAGAGHVPSFTCSVTVVLSDDRKVQEAGRPMPDKRKAMDDASRNMILKLFSMRLFA